VTQLIVISILSCGAIVIWGAIELETKGWETTSIYTKFSCIAAGVLLINIIASGIFYCIVWKRRSRDAREALTTELHSPLPFQDAYSHRHTDGQNFVTNAPVDDYREREEEIIPPSKVPWPEVNRVATRDSTADDQIVMEILSSRLSKLSKKKKKRDRSRIAHLKGESTVDTPIPSSDEDSE
jgi:hypothetical protein